MERRWDKKARVWEGIFFNLFRSGAGCCGPKYLHSNASALFSGEEGLQPKGVGPSTTLAWPGWKQPDIAVKVDRHNSKRACSKNVVWSAYYCTTLVLNSRVLLMYTDTVKELPGYPVGCVHLYAFVSFRRLSPQFQFSLSAVCFNPFLFIWGLSCPRCVQALIISKLSQANYCIPRFLYSLLLVQYIMVTLALIKALIKYWLRNRA